MPFVKRDAISPPVRARDSGDLAPANAATTDNLSSTNAETRWSAARALGGHRDAVPSLAAALAAEQVPRVREAIMTALMRIGDESSIKVMLTYLRSQDASLRASAIEALQALPEGITPMLHTLLTDSDSDVRILATELVRNVPVADATRHLCALLETEKHPNVCAAAIELLTEVGTRDAVPALRSCAARFATIPFLTFAATTAIARISDTDAEK
jgi:HEAT repeat protein